MSPATSALPGALTGIADGPKGWIAVGRDSRGPLALTSASGATWRVDSATFPGEGPALEGVAAAGPNGYLVVGTTVNKESSHSVAAMWSSADLRTWDHYDNRYADGKYIDGGDYNSFVAAVAGTRAGAFFTVGSVHESQGYECAVWTPLPNSARQWLYSPIPLPSGVSSAALDLVTVNASGFAVAAGRAVLENGGDAPVVAVPATDGQRWKLIQLEVPHGSQGSVTALTATNSGFIVAGEIGQADGTARAVTWSLPYPSDASSWAKVAPLSSNVPDISALSAIGGAGQYGQAARTVKLPAP